MIKLFESTATSFDTLGLGNLTDCTKCEVTEERNGTFELVLEYPIDGIHYEDIKLRSIIVCKSNPYSNEQAFRVYYISKPIKGIVTINAEHISYDMSGITVSPFEAVGIGNALNGLKTNSVPSCPFDFSTDKDTYSGTFKVKEPSSLRSLLGGVDGSILDIFGTGEYEFNNYSVSLYLHRGMDRGVTIRYGKNLTDLTQEENCSKVYTHVYPFWSGVEYDSETSKDVLITLPEKVVAVEGTFNYTRVLPINLNERFQNEAPTVDQLREAARKYIVDNKVGVPKVNLKVSFIQLEQAQEYEQLRLLEAVYLCDTVTVIFEELGVNSTAKCIKTVYNPITDKYTSLEFGDSATNLASTIVSQGEEIANSPTASFMEQEITKATKLITGGLGGYVILHSSSGQKQPDELLILGEESKGEITRARNVWRFNMKGLGFSSTGYNGTYKSIALTVDGDDKGTILADKVAASGIQAGTINAALRIIAPYIGDNEDISKASFYMDSATKVIHGATFGNGKPSSTSQINLYSSVGTGLVFGTNIGFPEGCNILARPHSHDGFGTTLAGDKYTGVFMWYNTIMKYWNSGTLYLEAQWGGGNGSDRRIKKDIKDICIESIRKFFRKIRPVTFKYIESEEKGDSTNYGYIAQEILPIIEECGMEENQFVITNDKGYYELLYPNLARLDSMAVHDLYNIVDNLQTQINELREEIKKK